MKMKKVLYCILIFICSSLVMMGYLHAADEDRNLSADKSPGIYETSADRPEDINQNRIEKNQDYSKPEDVAEYIHIYQQLPPNYITKDEALALGWKNNEGNLWEVTDKKCIGGDIFGNREGLLPKSEGRIWRECDVNYYGGYRGGERIVYSNDGLIYYTDDHYASFKQFY